MSNLTITIESTDADGVRAAINKALPSIVADCAERLRITFGGGNITYGGDTISVKGDIPTRKERSNASLTSLGEGKYHLEISGTADYIYEKVKAMSKEHYAVADKYAPHPIRAAE